MQQLLLLGQVLNDLIIMLGDVGSHGRSQLALEGDRSNLCGNHVHRIIIIGFRCWAQRAKHIVAHVREGRGVTLVPGRG